MEEVIEKKEEENAQLHKKLKRQDTLNQQIFPCTKCTKNFLSAQLLNNHILRKHPPAQLQESKDKDSNLINTIKLELEIKQLKEKLNSTEKDLMETKEKPVAIATCEKCRQNAQRKFQTVGIQSNFEEKEKDDIEKDAICELLSNQNKQFEEWKMKIEASHHLQMSELSAKLDETNKSLKKIEAQKEIRVPSPAPRLMKIAEKCIGTSRSVESLPEQKSDETIWKARYAELEKMYEENQQRMVETVTSIEDAYVKKMSNIEQTVNQLKEERAKATEELLLQTEKPEVPLSPKVIKQIHVRHQISSSSESDTEEIIQAKPLVVHPALSVFQPELNPVDKSPEEAKKALKTFGDQKFLIRPKKGKTKIAEPSTSMPQLPMTREAAETLFAKRLKKHGISTQSSRMNKTEFQRVHSEMVHVREENMKKNKSFYLTRKKIQSSVEKIFQKRSQRKDIKQSDKAETVEKSKRTLQPIESKTSVVLPEQAPAKAATSQTFRADLDRMLKSKLPVSSLNTKPLNVDPSQPITAKKKVLFDLKEEDDSDFDLSSFTSEFEENEKPYKLTAEFNI